jgi:hypothetical protein
VDPCSPTNFFLAISVLICGMTTFRAHGCKSICSCVVASSFRLPLEQVCFQRYKRIVHLAVVQYYNVVGF